MLFGALLFLDRAVVGLSTPAGVKAVEAVEDLEMGGFNVLSAIFHDPEAE